MSRAVMHISITVFLNLFLVRGTLPWVYNNFAAPLTTYNSLVYSRQVQKLAAPLELVRAIKGAAAPRLRTTALLLNKTGQIETNCFGPLSNITCSTH